MKAAIPFVLLWAGMASAADFACMEDCVRQGRARNYCLAICDNRPGPGAGGLMDQPGLPRNPAFDQIQPKNDLPQQNLPQATDAKCMKDCNRRGYDYLLCRKQCGYSLYGQ